jgi:hypothetical protein
MNLGIPWLRMNQKPKTFAKHIHPLNLALILHFSFFILHFSFFKASAR